MKKISIRKAGSVKLTSKAAAVWSIGGPCIN
jgi:hypothetical protein